MMNIDREKQGQAGAALWVAVAVVMVLGVTGTTGFYLARQEGRIGMASQNSAMAFYIAEQGMNEITANWNAFPYSAIPLWDSVSFTGNSGPGQYRVNVFHLTDYMYFIESTGEVTEGGLYAGATRKLGLLAKVHTAWIEPKAALVTRGPTQVGGRAQVIGYDSIPPTWSTDPDRCTETLIDGPGIVSDASGQVSTQGNRAEISGDPATVVDTTVSDSTFLDYGELGWNDLVMMAQADGKDITSQGSAISDVGPTEVDGLCETSNPSNWGEPYLAETTERGTTIVPVASCMDYFPLVYHEGNLGLQGNGRGQGILLVGKIAEDGSMSGNLDLRGNFFFFGIIIVLGSFETQSADPKIYGAVYAGNAAMEPNGQDITGGSVVQYSSCAARQVIVKNASFTRIQPLANRSFVDLSNLSYFRPEAVAVADTLAEAEPG